MNGTRILYRMNTLMNFAELDAFTAQKNAGSKSNYFGLLEQFMLCAPDILQALMNMVVQSEWDDYLEKINELQNHLIAVGSTSIMWEAEKAAESVRSGEFKACADETRALVAKVHALLAHIEEARADTSIMPHAMGERATTAPATPRMQNMPKAIIRRDAFEKLHLLIENFELDDAMNLLLSMMNSSYSSAIDAALARIHKYVANFDYEASLLETKKVLDMIAAIESDSEQHAKKKILAIDDVPDVLNTVKAVLKNEYAVYGATNHMAALKFLTTNKADLILLDIEMPDMSGFALLGIIRKIKAYKETPVVFLTGNVSVDNIKKSHMAGGNDFIRKPIDAQILLARIKNHLGNK